MRAHAERARVVAATSLRDLLEHADVVISAVTASQAVAVADGPRPRCARHVVRGPQLRLPGGQGADERAVDGAGGRFVESAVMTSVPPYGIKVPMLLGGRDAAALRELLAPLGFVMEIAAERVGVASAIKMCRSVMIKGLESLVTESFTAARAYGVEDRVLASLHETFPTLDWEQLGAYLMSRSALHGKRRAEEMREVAVTVREIGLDRSWPRRRRSGRTGWAGRRSRSASTSSPKDANWREYADRLLAARRPDR